MSLALLKRAAIFLLPALLLACGGSSGDSAPSNAMSSQADTRSTTLLPTVFTSEGRIINSCVLSPACSGNPYAPFYASLNAAPPNQATVSGIVRLEVYGNAMQNVELLPANGYTPKYGRFNISGDRVFAWMDLDTTRLPNGPLALRISAFSAPAGQGGNEIVAMPARTWTISNAGVTNPALRVDSVIAPSAGASVSGTVRLQVRGNGIVNAELLPATGYSPRLGVFNVSGDRTTATLDLDTRSLLEGINTVRISVFNATQGQPGSTELIAMPARVWNVGNGLPSGVFTARVLNAPVQAELVSGLVTLEVRGAGLRNVELLPANGYAPRYASFSISADQTFAWAVLDTTTLPNGLFTARISAFNGQAGAPNAREIVAMPTREWRISN